MTVWSTSRSGNAYVDGLLGQYQWLGFVRYSFPTRREQWTGYSGTGATEVDNSPRALTAAQQTAAINVLNQVKAFTNLDIRDWTFSAADAEIRFGQTADPDLSTAGAYLPDSDEIAGDVWFTSRNSDYLAPTPGTYGYFGFLHEIGHALGLEHPHEGGPFGKMPSDKDHMAYTVMTYKSYQNAPEGYSNGDADYATTFMMYDIAALQHMYGANYGANGGDTVYSWSPLNGLMTVNGAAAPGGAGNRIFMTVWDGGGIDTYDFSAYGSDLQVDLRPGAWTQTSQSQLADLGDNVRAPGNIANALLYRNNPASLIENAIGGAGNDKMTGNAAANRLEGRDGTDELDGGAGADTLVGGTGNDFYWVDDAGDVVIERAGEGTEDKVATSVSWTLTEGSEVERVTLTGTSATARTLTGNSLNNYLIGSFGNDILDGGAGDDVMAGGEGDDLYIVDSLGDVVLDGTGTSTVRSTISYKLEITVQNLELAGTAAIDATGNRSNNLITGNDAANVIDGREGADWMTGKGGDDTYVVDDTADIVVEGAGGGNDLVLVSTAYPWSIYALADHVERATLTGGAGAQLIGNALDNVLTGSAGNNRLDGGAGADTMIGGEGIDLYIVDNQGDAVIELATGGDLDGVESSISYILPANVENLVLVGPAALNGTGNELANKIYGNGLANIIDGKGGADEMSGGYGDDAYYVDDAADKVIEQAGEGTDTVYAAFAFVLPSAVENFVLTGNAAVDLTGNRENNDLTGNGAANRMDGGEGADVLRGGGGDDLYLLDHYADLVVEAAGAGIDEVRTALVSYTLTDNVENLTGTTPVSSFAISLTGNALANVIVGGGASDTIRGGGGDDTLSDVATSGAMYGEDGNDRLSLVRSAGADETHILDGGIGDDEIRVSLGLKATLTISGGAGADKVVLDAVVAGSAVSVTLGGGRDTIVVGSNPGAYQLAAVTIADFETGATGDRIDFETLIAARLTGFSAGSNPFATGHMGLVQQGADALLQIDFDGGADSFQTLVVFKNVDQATLEEANLGYAVPRTEGTPGNDRLFGSTADELFRLEKGGDDEVQGRGGDDILYFGRAWTMGDIADGGTGTDTLVLQGDYTRFTYLQRISGVEILSLLPGSDARYGFAGGTVGYNLASIDSVVAAGATLTVDGSGLGADAAVRFDGSGEQDGRFVLLGGGAWDTLTGGAGNDRIEGGGGDDIIDGRSGADLMRGGAGDDDYRVDNAGDVVEEAAGEGFDHVTTALSSFALSGNVEWLTGTSALGQTLLGNALANRIEGSYGNDVIDGAGGADLMNGDLGNDVYFVDNVGDVVLDGGGTDEVRTSLESYTLEDAIENLTADDGIFSRTAHSFTGNALANVITGGAGDDVIDGVAGADLLRGGRGDDIYLIDGVGVYVDEKAGEGVDEVRTRLASYSIESFAEIELLTGLGTKQTLIGNAGANTILGTSGNDTIDGRGGADLLRGGLGDDIYFVDQSGDAVEEAAGAGTDEVRSAAAAYALGANVEKLTGILGSGQSLTGNGLANVILGGGGNDVIDGGAGADTMSGGRGNDVYIVDDAGDQVVEASGEGTDEIRTALSSYSLAALAQVENLTGTSAGGQTLTGNDLDNVIFAGMGDDTLIGGYGDDVLIGFGGSDVMKGGAGNDIYIIDAGDTVVEFAGDGYDEVRTQATIFVLTDTLENLRATSDIGHDFRGNGGNNVIVGGDGNDIVRGQDGGDDLLFGKGGVDTFYLGASFSSGDLVDGGDNRDSLILQGDYSAGLTFVWAITGGSSLVNVEGVSLLSGSVTSFGDTGGHLYSYDLTMVDANVAAGALMKVNGVNLQAGENFTFDGSAETDAPFQLFAGFGTDDLTGGQQGDSFVFAQDGRFGAGDKVDGQDGYDLFYLRGDYVIDFNAAGFAGSLKNIESIALLTSANTEFAGGGDGDFDYDLTWNDAMLAAGANLTVNGSRLQSFETFVFDGSRETNGSFRLFGGAGDDRLTGGEGNDLIYGGGGGDTLRGGGGNDVFRYQSPTESPAAGPRDSIMDFSTGDHIDLARIDADVKSAGDQAFAFIGSGAFTGHAGELRAVQVFGSDIWTIEADVDGDGAADFGLYLVTSDKHALTAADFML